jgi:N-acetyl-1-D-myo-inositol-2-amino-2-deoxy-alpha-D-glucopyranoside deacetylase
VSNVTTTPGSTPIDRGAVLTVALASVFAFAIGFAVGFVTTFTHRQYQPWGLVAGLVVIVALVAGFRLVFDSRVIAAASALGVITATVLLTLPGAGGSVFVVDDALGWIWAIAPTVLAVGVVSFPRLRRSKMDQ